MNRRLDDLFISHRRQPDARCPSLDILRGPGTGPDAGFQEGCDPGESEAGNCLGRGSERQPGPHLPAEATTTFALKRPYWGGSPRH